MSMVRPARPADIPALLALLELLFSLETDFSFDAARQRRGLELLLDRPDARVLAAEVDGRIAGMCSGQLTLSTAEGGPALLVEDVVVHEQYRGRGIGGALLKRIAAWGESRGASRLQLLADRDNGPALEFYRKRGWRTTRLICLCRTLPPAF